MGGPTDWDVEAGFCAAQGHDASRTRTGGRTETRRRRAQHDTCVFRSKTSLRMMRARGGREGECKERRAAAFQECVEHECKEPPPPDPTCEERCEARAAEARAACIADGGGEDFCHGLSLDVFRECVASECKEPPPPEPTCEEKCREHSKAVFRECFGRDGSEGSTAGGTGRGKKKWSCRRDGP